MNSFMTPENIMKYGNAQQSAKTGASELSDLLSAEDYKELKDFIYTVTLGLQSHRSKTNKQLDSLFQRAYRLYVKHDVEGR